MRRSMRSGAAATVFICVALVASARAQDFSYDILPPGQYGNLPTTVHSTDQLPLYDSLTPLRGNVSVGDIERLYKPEDFEPNGSTTSVETGRPGLTILRDSFGVPFIYGTTLDDVWFGVGFATAQDRALLLRLGREAARAIVADIPGVDPLMLLINASSFVPSAQTEDLVTAQQQKLVRAYGAKGRQMLRDLAAYADGVTAGFQQSGGLDRPWTVNDAIAITAFIGSIFGNGGGDEVRNSEFLARLRAQLGAKRGSHAFVDLMAANDPESPVTMRRRFFYGVSGGNVPRGSLLVDPGSVQLAAPGVPRRLASNFLVASPERSATRETLFVAGPQLGYSYPGIVLEASLHGPGLLAQGALVPGGGPLPADRSDHRLCVEPHHRHERQSRSDPRRAVRAERVGADADVALLSSSGRVPGDGPLRRRHTRQRTRVVRHDRLRSGAGNGHRARQAVRHHPAPLHLRAGRPLAGGAA